MPKPPPAPPPSDIEGVDQDEVDNVEAAEAAGQSPADLERARRQSKGRPEQSREPGRDDRSR